MAGHLNDYAKAIFDAEKAVEAADLAYRKGGSPAALNKANRELADRQFEYWECSGGNVRDTR
jgi:hypothetical protein